MQIQVVHCHQAFSVMALEAMLAARPLGCRLVFTDHSLLGLGSPAGAAINKLMKLLLPDADHIICVSHVARENTVLRARVPPEQVRLSTGSPGPRQDAVSSGDALFKVAL